MTDFNPQDFNFDEQIELNEIPVKWGGEEYILREASGDAAAKYQNALMASASVKEDGSITSLRGLADAEMLLVHLCIWKGDKNVPLIEVKKWPSRIVSKLYETAKEISEIDRDDSLETLEKKRERLDKLIKEKKEKSDPAKNGQSDSMDGSESQESGDTLGQ